MSEMPELPDHIKELAAECIQKHVDVVQAILSKEHGSNTAAYMSVYPNSSAEAAESSVCAILRIPRVVEVFNALRDHNLSQNALSRAEAIDILSNIARHSLNDLVEYGTRTVKDKHGEDVEVADWYFKPSADLTPEAMSIITELASTKEGHRIKVHDQKAAIKQLAEMSGWNAAQEVKVSHGITHIESDYVDP